MPQRRLNELFDVKLHDPYMKPESYDDPTICPECHLVFHNKRWQWNEELYKRFKKEGTADEKLCPACRKIRDRYYMGEVVLEGSFLQQKKDEILRILRNVEEQEKSRRPLSRIMWIEDNGDALRVYTTSEHLAVTLGRAVHRAYQGEISMDFADGQKFARVLWRREA